VAGVVDCIGGQIPDHTPTAAGAVITLTAFAPDTPGTYINQVEVDPDHTIVEGNEFDNNASAQTVVKNGGTGSFNDLTVSFSRTGQPLHDARRTITYLLNVSTWGRRRFERCGSRHPPAGVTFVSARMPAGSARSPPGGGIDCTGATIAGTVPAPRENDHHHVTAPNTRALW
jgi:hypothetical protein